LDILLRKLLYWLNNSVIFSGKPMGSGELQDMFLFKLYMERIL